MILEKLEKIISPIYMVGGSVRDEILSIEPKDYDFTTPKNPDQIENAIRKVGKKPYLIGKRFGTIGVKIDNHFVEITTFRTEKYKQGSRKPNVTFVSDITLDLSRRDFTINAIAKHKNQYIDPFNGISDIKKQIIKTVGNAEERFNEDPLRMLRAARFSSQLNFKIDEKIKYTTKKLSYKILETSKERWVMEIDKLLLSNNPSLGLDFLAETNLLNFIIPELSIQYKQDFRISTIWEKTKILVKKSENILENRWAALLKNISKSIIYPTNKKQLQYFLLTKELVQKISIYLKWSKKRTQTIIEILEEKYK